MENISEQIIELVHQNPSLYDKSNSKYKDIKYKETVWEDIANQTNLSVKECKVKWKSLRDRYRKQKMAENLPSGSSQKIGPPWKYMQNLSFLAESVEPACTIGNISEDLDTSVEWLFEDNTNTTCSTTQPTRKRKNDDLFTEVLMAMKKKYEEPPNPLNKDKYRHFFEMLKEKFNKLDESEVDDVQVEILKLVNQKIFYKN